MLLVIFNTWMKLTFLKLWQTVVIVFVLALATGWSWPYAIEQSWTQIQDWLANPTLMLDTSVVLTIEVIWQMSFCLLAAHLLYAGTVRRRTVHIYRLLRWMPGVLIFPVLFSGLVALIFALPGTEFTVVAWGLSGSLFLLVPVATWGLRMLLPEKELRLELLFLCNALVAIIGVIATVNGRTAVAGTDTTDWSAFGGCAGLVIAGSLIGMAIRQRRIRKQSRTGGSRNP